LNPGSAEEEEGEEKEEEEEDDDDENLNVNESITTSSCALLNNKFNGCYITYIGLHSSAIATVHAYTYIQAKRLNYLKL
jgi:hypothetical protein